MDHLPIVANAIVPGLDNVPHVCKKPYDGGPFLTYPVREDRPEFTLDPARMAKEILRKSGKDDPSQTKDFEAFCQTWLFFGLIHELLGNICTSAEFLQSTEDGNGSVISTLRLPTLIEQWVTTVRSGSSSVTYKHVAQCLRLTHSALMSAGPGFDLSIKMCIASVGELFEYAANTAFKIGNLVLENACPATWRSLFTSDVQAELLGRSKWCPSQIEILVCSPTHLQSLYFFASMHDPSSIERHGLCDKSKCVAYQTDLKKYQTQHATKECTCQEFCVDTSSLDAIVKSGGLALIRIREAETLDQLAVDLVAAQPASRYLALSHVWADGLGNAKANALPRCQLLQLGRLTEDLRVKTSSDEDQSELLFWCDTLCCPASPGDGKNKVLEQMREIYQQAECVLVLDASLRSHKGKAMCSEEACARIIASGWMRRLWTLQEGALPADRGRLWFQFCDEAVNLKSLWQDILKIFNDDWSRRGLATDILVRMRFLKNFFHRETGADLTLVDEALRYRSVSVSSDEPLLIGSLLGLDVACILNGSPETRIRRMWSLMPTAVRGIPKSILFRLGPRLEEKGYRWAPSTMLHYESTNTILATMSKGDDQGIPTDDGLLVRLSGYHISFPEHLNWLPEDLWNISLDKDLLYMRNDEANWFIVRRRCPNVEGDNLSKEGFSYTNLRCSTDLWMTTLKTDYQSRADSFEQTDTALLTKLGNESDDVKYVRSYMHVHVFRYRANVHEMLEAAYQCAQELGESAPAQNVASISGGEPRTGSTTPESVIEVLESEIRSITASGRYDRALAIARERWPTDDDALFGVFVRLMFMGRYAIMGPRTPESQQWCVD